MAASRMDLQSCCLLLVLLFTVALAINREKVGMVMVMVVMMMMVMIMMVVVMIGIYDDNEDCWINIDRLQVNIDQGKKSIIVIQSSPYVLLGQSMYIHENV